MNLNPCENILIQSGIDQPQQIKCIRQADLDENIQTLTEIQSNWVTQNQFSAKKQSYIRIPNNANQDIIWLGIGAGSVLDLRDSSAWLSQQLAIGIYAFDTAEDHFELGLGWALGQYQFDRYLSERKEKNQLVINDEIRPKITEIGNGLFLARDLINTPTNDMGPSHLSEVVQAVASQYEAEFTEILDQELLDKGYRTIYTVGMAADNRPRLLELKWGNDDAPKVTLVGKGVCFDTGGLDIKPGAGMLIMKKDMGGAAHALALATMVMSAKLNINLRVLLPAVENSISSNAFRPGDVIKTYKGTTVEIGNTDAEGRLILCDALALGGEDKPDLMIDFATLTGAARVAMGADVVPFFTDDEDLASGLAEHSAAVSDPLWRLPLYKGYESQLKSTIADLNNISSSPFGGAITAGLFLKNFVPEKTTWAHIDLYGWNQSDKATCHKGGQSMAIHAVFSYLASL